MDEATFIKDFHNVDYVKKIRYKALGNTGMRVSFVSLGAGPLGNCYAHMTLQEGCDMIQSGLKAGLNYIDTAPFYGNGLSETVLGQALKGVPREAYYIATKVGRYEPNIEKMFNFTAEKTYASVDESLSRLGLDYVDLIQVHDLEYADDIQQVINETLPALEKIVQQGKAKHIGITSYSLELLRTVLESSTVKIETVLSYARNNFMDDGIREYLPYFQSKGVGVISGSNTILGLLTSGGEQDWHPAGQDIRAAAAKARQLAKTRGVELAHLALKSAVETEGVTTSLLGCTSAEMVLGSIDAVSTPFTQQELALIEEMQTTCFSELQSRSWGTSAEDEYFRKMKEIKQKQNN